jgi:flagellar biosynthesis/type III secretory pathway M-ring protein FliF/YscJ
MKNLQTLVNVALILLGVIVLGAVLRSFSFPRVVPEGFEVQKKDENKGVVDEEADEKTAPKEGEGEGEGKEKGEEKAKTDGGEKKEDGGVKQDETHKDDEKTKAVALDFDKNMKEFLSEHGGNDSMMKSLHKDAKALMKNQEELMGMLHTATPMIKSSMGMLKAFKGMLGES